LHYFIFALGYASLTQPTLYLELCKEAKKTPRKSYKGSFNVRVSPEVHGKAITKAKQLGISLNKLVQSAIEHEVDDRHCHIIPDKKRASG